MLIGYASSQGVGSRVLDLSRSDRAIVPLSASHLMARPPPFRRTGVADDPLPL